MGCPLGTCTNTGLILATVSTIYEIKFAAILFTMVAKYFSGLAFAGTYLCTVELFPTIIQGNALGFSSLTARIMGLLAPIILSLQEEYTWAPGFIFGGLGCFMAVFCYFCLPETRECRR